MSNGTEVATLPDVGEVASVDASSGVVDRLIELAMEKKVDVGVLEKLVDLRERVEMRNARASYFEAVASFQDECPEIAKSRTAKIATRKGSNYSYTYAPLEEITRTIRPVLRKNGLSYSWDTEPGENGFLNVVCVLRHVDGHEERSTFPVPTATDAAMSEAQKQGAALTYGRRQSLIAVLGLTAADDDNDAPKRHAKISREQAADIRSLMEEVGANEAGFLKYMKVRAIEDISADRADEAVAALERKRDQG